MDRAGGTRVGRLRLVRIGLLWGLVAGGCGAPFPAGSGAAAPSPSTAAAPTELVAAPTPFGSDLLPVSSPIVASPDVASQEPTPADPEEALAGLGVEGLGEDGADVVLRIGADGFVLPGRERLYDVHGDRVLAAREGRNGAPAVLVVRDLEGELVREIASGMDVPQTGIVRGEDVYFGGIDLGEDGSIDTATDRGVWIARGDETPEPVLAAEPGLAVYTAIERSPDGRTLGIWRCGEACATILLGRDGRVVEVPQPGLIALANEVALLIGAYSDVTAHAVRDGAVLWRAETDGIYGERYATTDGDHFVLSAIEDAAEATASQLRIELLDAATGAVERSVVVPGGIAAPWVAPSLSTDRYVAILDAVLPDTGDAPNAVQVVDLAAERLLDFTLMLGGVR